MVGVAVGDNGSHSFLISDTGEKEIRRFLTLAGIRPARRGFRFLLPRPLSKFSAYRLSGDLHLQVLTQKLPRITWGRLALYLVGGCSVGYLFHEDFLP